MTIKKSYKNAVSVQHIRTLGEFFTRYGAVLDATARRVHALVERGAKYTSTEEVAAWIAHSLPEMYRRTFGRTPKPLKTWRVQTMLSNANYLGAFEELDIRAVRGRGLTTVVAPRKKAALRVIRGGKS